MRRHGFLILQGIVFCYSICKTIFYYNESNGALKRAGLSDHRFDQGHELWEQAIFGGIVIFSAFFFISNQITLSKEVYRIMTPQPASESESESESEEQQEEEPGQVMKVINTTQKILTWPSSGWKTLVAGQSFLRLSYKLLYLGSKSKNISLVVGGTLTLLCTVSSFLCNRVFFKEKRHLSERQINEMSPLLSTTEQSVRGNGARWSCLAHGLSVVLAVMIYVLYFNSINFFPPHLNDKFPPLWLADNGGDIAGLVCVLISDLFIAASTGRGYSFRLRKNWIPEHMPHTLASTWSKGDTVDLVGSIAKAITSSMSLMAITYGPLGLEGSLAAAVVAFPGNAFCEAATFFRRSPQFLVKTGRSLGFHNEGDEERRKCSPCLC